MLSNNLSRRLLAHQVVFYMVAAPALHHGTPRQAASGDDLSTTNTVPMPLIHTLQTSMSLPLPCETVFAFFAEATNLQRITPPELGFEMVTPQPTSIHEGTRIAYRLHLFGIPFTWQS